MAIPKETRVVASGPPTGTRTKAPERKARLKQAVFTPLEARRLTGMRKWKAKADGCGEVTNSQLIIYRRVYGYSKRGVRTAPSGDGNN